MEFFWVFTVLFHLEGGITAIVSDAYVDRDICQSAAKEVAQLYQAQRRPHQVEVIDCQSVEFFEVEEE